MPDFGVYGDAEAEVLFAEVERLFAWVADGFGRISRGGVVEIVDDVVCYVGQFFSRGDVRGIDG